MYETYLRRGGWERFGLPVTNRWRTSYRGVAVWTQRFTAGTIQWSPRAVRASVSPATTSPSGTRGFRDALAASGLRAGVVYRSGDLTSSGKTGRALLGGLLYRGTIIDLRTPAERSRRPDPTLPGVSRARHPLPAAKSPRDLVRDAGSRAALRKVLARVASGSGPVLLHCGDNRIRTGWAVALVMFAAGAGDDEVVSEYVRTSGASRAGIIAAIDRVEADHGSVRDYLLDGLGLAQSQLDAIRARTA